MFFRGDIKPGQMINSLPVEKSYLIEKQFLLTGVWYFGSALSMILMIFILLSIWLMKRFDSDGQAGGALPW